MPGSDVRSSVATQVYDALAGVPETTAPASGATAATTAAGGTATTGFDITEPFKMAGTLLHDAAMVLNFFFAFFRPGQMWRVVFAIIAALAGAVAARLYAAGDTAANMPAIFALLGTMLIAGFMAFRGWPLSAASGQPIRPAAYVVDIAKGQIPPAQQLPDETTPIEWGLTVIFALWAVNKVAGLFGSSLGSLIGNLFGWLKDVFTAAPAVLPEAGLLSEQTASPAGLTVAAPDYSAASPGLASPGTAITGPGVVLA